jgi:hypothetical protein
MAHLPLGGPCERPEAPRSTNGIKSYVKLHRSATLPRSIGPSTKPAGIVFVNDGEKGGSTTEDSAIGTKRSSPYSTLTIPKTLQQAHHGRLTKKIHHPLIVRLPQTRHLIPTHTRPKPPVPQPGFPPPPHHSARAARPVDINVGQE